jgi:protoheme IX farnesyltransferase
LDRDLDARMQRTRGRPVPAGVIQPGRALAFGVLLTALAAALGGLTLNALALTFVLLGIAVYVGVYTMWLKRRSIWNIVIGGGAGSCAALAGGAAASGSIDLAAALIGALVFVWTPSHFWSLAVRAREDYVRARVPMLPAIVGPSAATRWIVGNTLLLLPISLIFPLVSGFGVLYLGVALVANAFLLYSNIRLLHEPSPSNAWFAFKISSPYLAVLFAAMLLEALPIFP